MPQNPPQALSLKDEKRNLLKMLHTAFQLELGTIPPYMMALVSIKPRTNRAAANIIRSVMLEEMLHILLMGNLISAIGEKVVIDSSVVPQFPLTLKFNKERFKDRQFDIDLDRFSESTISTFSKVELPTDWAKEELALLGFQLDVPGIAIGDFYQIIKTELGRICKEHGEENVFSGTPTHQIDQDYYWSGKGKPIVITGLSTALEALDLIINQGEGTSVDPIEKVGNGLTDTENLPHFYRFRQIQFKKYYKSGDDPRQPPTGEEFEVDYSEVFPMKKNAKSSDYASGSKLAALNNEFNRNYTLMLIQMAEAFNGSPKTMYTAIMNGMHGLTPIATEMVSTPIEGDPDGLHGAPSFEWVKFAC